MDRRTTRNQFPAFFPIFYLEFKKSHNVHIHVCKITQNEDFYTDDLHWKKYAIERTKRMNKYILKKAIEMLWGKSYKAIGFKLMIRRKKGRQTGDRDDIGRFQMLIVSKTFPISPSKFSNKARNKFPSFLYPISSIAVKATWILRP